LEKENEALHAELKLRDASRLSLAWLREATDDVVRAHVGVSKLGLDHLLIILEEMKAETALQSDLMGWRQHITMCLFMLKVDPGVRVVKSRFGLNSICHAFGHARFLN